MKASKYELCILIVVFVLLVIVLSKQSKITENYRDPIFMQPHKFYADYYPRTNGSIYGSPNGGWDLFSGVNFYPKAY